jgi:dienelactone hydrolase
MLAHVIAAVLATVPTAPPHPAAAPVAAPAAIVTSHQATKHAMRFLVALPVGWAPGRAWPVVVVIADAHRDFAENLRRFVAVRGDRPFLLVAPEVVTCGGTRDQTSPPYTYTDAEWQLARAPKDHDFDDAGLAAVLADVHAKWSGEERAYLTGWEAGGHTVWAQALRRPERWRAVAPVTTNYQGRGLTAETFSRGPERATLPIQTFVCGAPKGELAGYMPGVRRQIDRAIADARAHGFAPAPVRVVPGADHGPLPEAVTAWFDSLEQARGKGAARH